MSEISKYTHSSQISNRRRELFPTIEDDDSELGHISPLSLSDCDEHYVDDYVILGSINKTNEQNVESVLNTPPNKRLRMNSGSLMSPLRLSPALSHPDSPFSSTCGNDTIIPDTPLKESPTDKLKTPQDITNLNTKVPKLVRKSFLDMSFNDIASNNRELASPVKSSEIKSKLDTSFTKSSKVRTALFPESSNITVPAKSFYPKCENIRSEQHRLTSINVKTEKMKSKLSCIYLCKRGKVKNRFGQINAGVRHKIKKPNRKKISKAHILKAAINIMENSPLNEYLEELAQLKNPPKKQIQALKPPVSNTCAEINCRKRERSPSTTENTKNKFFKSSRTESVLKTGENSQVNNENVNTTKNAETESTNVFEFDVSDLSVPDDNFVLTNAVDSILDKLEEDKENTVTLTAHNSVYASENSIMLHEIPVGVKGGELLLSPISQMCDTTSGLVLTSPKKNKNLNNILQNMPNGNELNVFNKVSVENEQQNVYPVFLPNYNPEIPERKIKTSVNNCNKKLKNLSRNQMLLDAGQKRFGHTQCPECKFFYHMGDPNEELNHLNYHNGGNVLRFDGWKNERIVTNIFPSARIIKIVPGDSKIWWKKVKDLQEIINRELGYYEMPLIESENTQAYLYIKNRNIIGCLIAEPRNTAYKILPTEGEIDLCSENSYPIKCGVQRIWVLQKYRKEGIGAALMDCLRTNFMFGYFLRLNDIALSAPTELGKLFAKSYFKTPNYFIYM